MCTRLCWAPSWEITHDASARVVARGEHAGARRRQLIPAVRVADRGVEQLGEAGQPLLGVIGRRPEVRPDRGERAPRATVHDDGGRNRRPDGALARGIADRTSRVPEVVQPRGASRAQHGRVTFVPPSGKRSPIRTGAAAPLAATTVSVSPSCRASDTDEACRISATSCVTASKTALGWAPRATSVATRRSAACSAAKTRNLAWALALEIAVATELREVLEARLGLGRERVRRLRGGGHHAPRPPLHGDRDADCGADAHPPDRGRDDAGAVPRSRPCAPVAPLRSTRTDTLSPSSGKPRSRRDARVVPHGATLTTVPSGPEAS